MIENILSTSVFIMIISFSIIKFDISPSEKIDTGMAIILFFSSIASFIFTIWYIWT